MNRIIIGGLDLNFYEDVLDNGLKVILCKIPRNSVHARISTFFGGSNLEFKLSSEKEFTKVPAGVAHFLEHKLFEKKDYDVTERFEKNGAYCNAFTTPFVTSYYFSGSKKFYDNLTNLLDLVHNPYFTDENVEKEKGIISQEKKEDLDDPYSIIYDKSLINTFKYLNYKNTVLGSLKDISSITKEDLNKCYKTFYHPSNMVLTIAGDINIKKTMEFIKEYYSLKDFGKPKQIIFKDCDEPDRVVKESDVIYKESNSKKIQVNYKIKIPKDFRNKYITWLYFCAFLDMNFGGLSDLYEIVHKDSNYLSKIFSRLTAVDDYYMVIFGVDIKRDEDKVIDLIDSYFKNKIYDEKRFELIKKATINSLIVSMESPSEICDMMVNHVRLYDRIIDDVFYLMKNLNFDDFNEFIGMLDLNNRSVVVLDNKKAN
ncbi:MAG: insulinase family protein [Bacilli bacterium]|nr:insulinase family protein [Bacilli bacterium]